MKYLCPVCGYPELPRAAQDDLICPCCGTHFGYDDYATTYDELRRTWMKKGAPWFSRAQAPPQGWDPIIQLARAGMIPFELGGARGEENRTDLQPEAPLRRITPLAA
jgi:hypothetical protein